jgi:hypothetical protein
VAIQNSSKLTANLPATVVCPANHFQGTNATNANCRSFSYPELYNNVIWQNRVFNISVGGLGTGPLNQQNVVTLVPTLNQPSTAATSANGGGTIVTGGSGACVSGANYWDIGVRGDSGPDNHASGVQLAPSYSVLTDVSAASGYSGAALHNTGSNPTVLSQYCNGSRVPPENGGLGYDVPAGISDATVPNPIFNLTPAVTVDEGNNWVNIAWGPLTLSSPSVVRAAGTNAPPLGNYTPATGSPAIDYVPSSATTYAAAPGFDFFGNTRKAGSAPVDAGAVEIAGAAAAATLSVTPTSLAFGNQPSGSTSATQNLTLHNTGTAGATGIGVVVTAPFTRVTTGTFPTGAGNCGATLAAGANCTVKVAFAPTATGAATGTATFTANVTVSGSPVTLTGTGTAAVVSASLTPTTWAATTVPATGCTGTGCPVQTFTLTNTGNVNLTGVGRGALGGTNPTQFTLMGASSTCGPGGTGYLGGMTTLTPGGSCTVTVRFTPTATGAYNASVSVTDLAGTQTSTLTGTRN